jgi:hypothetical protein
MGAAATGKAVSLRDRPYNCLPAARQAVFRGRNWLWRRLFPTVPALCWDGVEGGWAEAKAGLTLPLRLRLRLRLRRKLSPETNQLELTTLVDPRVKGFATLKPPPRCPGLVPGPVRDTIAFPEASAVCGHDRSRHEAGTARRGGWAEAKAGLTLRLRRKLSPETNQLELTTLADQRVKGFVTLKPPPRCPGLVPGPVRDTIAIPGASAVRDHDRSL